MLRQRIIEALSSALRGDAAVRAAWLGGSDATGRTDDRSDVDLVVIAEDGAVEGAFDLVERTLADLAPIGQRYRLPQPTWHGHEQAFYTLSGAPAHLMIDFVAVRRSAPPERRFLEPERHGTPLVLFDRDGLVKPVPLDRAAHERRVAQRLDELRQRFAMFRVLAEKTVPRGQEVEGAFGYQSFVLRPLVDLLRIRHCPDRFDFGPRYLERDLPPGVYHTLVRLSFAPDLATLGRHMAEATELFERTLREIEAARA